MIADVDDIVAIDVNGLRHYPVAPDKLYPSITTILGATGDKTFLDAWREKVGVDVAARLTKKAALRGTAVHRYAENYLLKQHYDVDLPDVDIHRTMPAVLDRISDIRGIEMVLYSDKYRMAGRTDCIAMFDNVLSIIDYKTSKKPKPIEFIRDYMLQGTAYSICYAEMYGVFIKDVVILIFNDAGDPQIVKVKIDMGMVNELVDRIAQFHKSIDTSATL
jgi:CRISPR/Cas system-associated exonuclease Cas4 (RecB family)